MAIVALVKKLVITAIVVDASVTIIQTIMLSLAVLRRAMQTWLPHSFCGGLLKDFNVDVVDINVEVVILELANLELGDKTMRAFVLTKPTGDLFRIHPESKLDWQL